MVLMKTEFGAMRTHEINALNGDLYTTSARPYENATDDETPNPEEGDRSCDPDRYACYLLCHQYDLYRRIFQRNRFCYRIFTE